MPSNATSTTVAPALAAEWSDAVLITDVDWTAYGRFLKLFAERPGFRLTYDRGALEIVSPSAKHDNSSRLLARMVYALTEELGLAVKSGGTTTLRRQAKKRGLEPDECFWIAREAAVRGVDQLDLRVHPAPDLAVEVDVAASSLDRMSIYRKLGVPEVWRIDAGGALTFERLGPDGRYGRSSTSVAFPQVTAADLMGFLALRLTAEENALVSDFRAWVRSWASSAP